MKREMYAEARLKSGTGEILDRALSGERISDDEALSLLESRDLVAVGRAANEIRNHKADPDRITFIIDRNLNYTNICYTDCDFCAFYRSPGDTREGYLLPKPVIFKKIEETIALGGTGLLMQGGHHPDLGIDYYEDLLEDDRSEEHTSELQSRQYLVCRLLLEKKKNKTKHNIST